MDELPLISYTEIGGAAQGGMTQAQRDRRSMKTGNAGQGGTKGREVKHWNCTEILHFHCLHRHFGPAKGQGAAGGGSRFKWEQEWGEVREDSKSPDEYLMWQGRKSQGEEVCEWIWSGQKAASSKAKSKGCCIHGDVMRQQLGHESELRRLSS